MCKKILEIEKKLPSITLPVWILSCIINQDSALQDNQQLDFECIIQDSKIQWIKASILMDTRASVLGFMSSVFVKQYCLSIVKLAQSYKLKFTDDTLASILTHGT